MAEYIGCRSCDSPSCKGCNIYTLATMLQSGKFDCLMNGNRAVNQFSDVVERNAFNRLMERYKKATGRMPNGVMRQMVEVVRCKDCKHCLQTSMHCVRPTAANKYPKMKADDFCSYGERREVNDAN